jgi:hypothetical protein
MADLVDRISGDDPARPGINVHRWIGVQRLYVMGLFTRADLAAEFDLQGAELTQGTQLADALDAQSNLNNKIVFISRIEAVLYCINDSEDGLYHNPDGSINKPKVYADMGITG